MIISKSNKHELRYILSPTRIEAVYSKLKKVLPKEISKIFAEPKIKEKTIQWEIEDEQDLYIQNIRNYPDLSLNEQEWIGDYLLKTKINITQYLNQDKELQRIAKSILTIPSVKSIKLLNTNNGNVIVLTDWAHLPFDSKIGYNPIGEIISSRTKLFHTIKINLLDKNRHQLPNENIIIEIDGIKRKFLSNENGEIILNEVFPNQNIKIYSLYGGIESKVNEFVVNQTKTYDIILDKPLKIEKQEDQKKSIKNQETEQETVQETKDIIINILDQNDNSVKFHDLIIKSGKEKIVKTSDEKGVIKLQDIYSLGLIEITDKNDNSNTKTFSLTSEENTINFYVNKEQEIKPVETYSKFYLLNLDNSPIVNAKMKFYFKGGIIEKITDNEGKCIVKNNTFKHKEKVKINIYHKNSLGEIQFYRAKIKYLNERDVYMLKYSEKRFAWLKKPWFIVLIVILIIIFLLALPNAK